MLGKRRYHTAPPPSSPSTVIATVLSVIVLSIPFVTKGSKYAFKNAQEMKIHMTHFKEAMKKIRPLSKQELTMYKNIASRFDPRVDSPNTMAKSRIDNTTAASSGLT
jgi:hypothetical protein